MSSRQEHEQEIEGEVILGRVAGVGGDLTTAKAVGWQEELSKPGMRFEVGARFQVIGDRKFSGVFTFGVSAG